MFGPLETNINASIAEADRLVKKREAELLAEIEKQKELVEFWKDKCVNCFLYCFEKKIIFN
jgi:hypothetical protein